MAITPKQTSFLTFAATQRTRRAEFFDTMNRVVPWSILVSVVEPHHSQGETGRPGTNLELLIRRLCLSVCHFRRTARSLDRTRFRSLEKNASRVTFAFSLANLYQVRRQILKTPLILAAPVAA